MPEPNSRQPIERLRSHTVVLPAADIDTDQIIPARFLVTTARDGLGRHAFHDWRGQPGCPLDDPRADGARILIAGANFGCGSSREHAAWALHDAGFRAVVSTDLADIFRSNAQKNGIVTAEIDGTAHEWLLQRPFATVEIDLRARQLRADGLGDVPFAIDDFARHCLLQGIDELGFLLQHAPQITAFETARP